MKKTILLAAGAVLLAAAVSAFVYVKNENNSMDELFEANVEALTRNESGGQYVICVKGYVPGNKTYHLCSSCERIATGVTEMALCMPR